MHIKVGLLFSLTGTTSLTEKGQFDAALFATEQFKKAGYDVEVMTEDIASDPYRAKECAEKLAQQGVKIFIGCYTSACRKAILPILEKYDCLLVYPTLYEGEEDHQHVFYTGEVPNQQVHTLIDYLMSHYGKNIYLIGNDYIYPKETNDQVREYVRKKGGNIVQETYVPFGHKEFYQTVQDIILQKPDAIFSTLVGQSVVSFYETYARMQLNPQTMPIFSPITKETEIEAMGSVVGAGHYSSASYFQSLDHPANSSFTQAFHSFTKDNRPISSVMFNTYIGTKIILDAVIETKSVSKEAIFTSLHGKTMDSACGALKIDQRSHLTRPMRIGKVMQDGQFDIVWDSAQNIRPKPYIKEVILKRPVNELILRAWGEVSSEAIVAISGDRKVQFLSRKAKELTNLRKGDTITPSVLQQLQQQFYIDSYAAKEKELWLVKAKRKITTPYQQFGLIRTKNEAFQHELKTAKIAANSIANVLILGETGTGKEVLARAIHEMSARKDEPFVAINMAALPKELLLSELFGYAEGAFTGAKRGGAVGKFEAAHKGTLFLDEIGDMPFEFQATLLRAIETKKVTRVGDVAERDVDIRIIAATNRNLEEEIAYNDAFRSDLFYRLNVLSIHIPALRDRVEDIELLAHHFLQLFAQEYGDGPESITGEVIQQILQYPWPGNIRELRNMMERAYLLAKSDGTNIQVEHLPAQLMHYYQRKQHHSLSLKDVEKKMIAEALETSNNIKEASEKLGIGRSTLYRKMKEFKMTN